MVFYRASALCGLLHVHAVRLRDDETQTGQIDLSVWIQDVHADLYRGDEIERMEREDCGHMHEEEYLELTPDLDRAISFASRELWSNLYCDVDRYQDVYNSKEEFHKVMMNKLGQFKGNLQKMNVKEKVFQVTEQSLADLFADEDYFDQVEEFSWTIQHYLHSEKKTLTSSRADLVRLGFQPGKITNHAYLYPATRVLQNYFSQRYPQVAGLSNQGNVKFDHFFKSMLPEFVLWKNTSIKSCTDRKIQMIPYVENAEFWIEEMRQSTLAYHRDDCDLPGFWHESPGESVKKLFRSDKPWYSKIRKF